MSDTPTSADDVQHPWIVLVKDGQVISRHRTEDNHTTSTDATRIILDGDDVEVYEVDVRQGPPPDVGTSVDPVQLGWVNVS